MMFVMPASAYTIDGDMVYENSSVVNLSATPHTIASTGWVYFTADSHTFTGDFDVAWGFNTSVARPTKAELYSPHWVNTTSQHTKTFYNVSSFEVYEGTELDYGNAYNTNYSYTAVHEVTTYNETTMEPDGSEWLTSNASFDSFVNDDGNYTITWHTRHDVWTLWKDKTDTFESITHDYQGYDKWYYIQDISVVAGQSYLLRAWVEVPITLEGTAGKYYFAVKPSGQTIPEAIADDHFYALDPWWDSSWNLFKTITINQSMVNQSIGTGHYTLLVETTDTDLRDHAQADGDDIVFTDSTNTTQLDHQLSVWNSTTGYIKAYVNVTDIANVSSINMYYNNSGATNTEDKAGTWGANAGGIWLMDEGEGSYVNDSSGNDNNGTIDGASWVYKGLYFDGINDVITKTLFSPDMVDTKSYTMAAWVNTSQNGSTDWTSRIVFIYDGSDGFGIALDIDGKPFVYTAGGNTLTAAGTSGTAINDDEWHLFVGVFDQLNNIVRVYVDGALDYQVTPYTDNSDTTNATLYIGEDQTGVDHYKGYIDLIQNYDRVLSPDEIATNYNNTEYPTLFISIGAEQSDTQPSFDINITYLNRDTDPNMIFDVSNITVDNWGFNYSLTEDTHHYYWRYANETLILHQAATSDNQTLNFSVTYLLPEGTYHLNESAVGDTSFTVTLPAGQSAINFTAATSKDTLLEPGGQSAGDPIVNITNTGDVTQSFRFYLNSTVTNVLTYTSLSSDLSSPTEINTTTTTIIITDLAESSSDNVWMYCNLSTPDPGNSSKQLTINSS
jgi:hypothetical protein